MYTWVALRYLAPILCALPALAQDEAPAAAPPRTGHFQSTFEERHPESSIEKQRKRSGWTAALVRETDPEEGRLELARESFQVYVPESYDGSRAFGLLVWISPSDDGRLPAAWVEAASSHDLIAVGADRAGNERYVWHRIGLALDAVHNLSSAYMIDPSRVWVTGFSGGGRTASRLGFQYPDVFTGGIYQGGCSFWEDVPVPGAEGQRWPAHFPKPSATRYRQTRRESRHVLLAGATDLNRDHSLAVHDALVERLAFAHVAWIEMEGAGHVPADAAAFERALAFLDDRRE